MLKINYYGSSNSKKKSKLQKAKKKCSSWIYLSGIEDIYYAEKY
jgi:hypothetical protein